MPKLPFESLHNHTTQSDGLQSHEQVLATAKKAGFGVVAFTDHDSLPTEQTLRHLRAYNGPVKWVSGVELSSGLPKELGGHLAGTLHILGLFVDPTNLALAQHCEKAVNARLERMQAIVINLNSIGITITADDCLKASGGEAVGRPHIVEAIGMHQENLGILAGIRDKMALEARHDEELAKDYQAMMAGPDIAHIYRLVLSGNSFVPDIYVNYKYWADMDTTVELIRGAGGLAIVAHWFTIAKQIDATKLEELLATGRLDGLETHNSDRANRPQTASEAMLLAGMAARTGKSKTIGIDEHREADYLFFASQRLAAAQKSIGQTERLISDNNVGTFWSNF